MNIHIVLFGVILCLVMVNCRHFDERRRADLSSDEPEEQIENNRRNREYSDGQMRHRRRRWQTNYGYNYPPQPNPYYPDERRDYNRQQDLLPHVLRLLDEISDYVKRPPPPPPPPQPIYVPYPVPYPVPQYCSCPSIGPTNKPNITNRFPEMEDSNQNWGYADAEEQDQDDGNDGSRPISFIPIKPKRPTSRPPPKVEHGSSQAGVTN